MVHPLLFLGLLAAKKSVVYAAYRAGSRYGWPRVYRRVLEYNRAFTPKDQQSGVKSLVKRALHSPEQLADAVKNNAVFQLAVKLVENPPGGVGRYPATAYHAFQTIVAGLGRQTTLTTLAEEFSKHAPKWAREGVGGRGIK